MFEDEEKRNNFENYLIKICNITWLNSLIINSEFFSFISQFLLTRFRSIIQGAFSQASARAKWSWTISATSDVDIKNLEDEFGKHLTKCHDQYIAEENDLNYIMDDFITIKVIVQNQEVKVMSSKKINFIVRAVY